MSKHHHYWMVVEGGGLVVSAGGKLLEWAVAILDGGNCSSGGLEFAVLKELLTFLTILNAIVPPVACVRKSPRAFGFDGSIDPRFVTLLRKLNQSNGGGGGGDGGFMVCQIFSNCFCAIVFCCVVYRVAGNRSPNKNGSCWMGSIRSRR